MKDVKEINIQTGEILDRDFTDTEIEQNNKSKQDSEKLNEVILKREQKNISAKQKLKDLGLDDDEIEALGV